MPVLPEWVSSAPGTSGSSASACEMLGYPHADHLRRTNGVCRREATQRATPYMLAQEREQFGWILRGLRRRGGRHGGELLLVGQERISSVLARRPVARPISSNDEVPSYWESWQVGAKGRGSRATSAAEPML